MGTDVSRWGLVVAAPHQHLIAIRKGRVVRSEQGGSHFRWPWDTVALVDTSVHRLQFSADQVTREKAGVKVSGLAVFRVVEPELAYRMLDLDRGDGHVEILREMFVGATRRLVANLTLEECITRRKDSLAAELMAEVAPVVGASGRQEDGTDRGWGIAIDTIEIQDVRILSEEVFERLQAPYRAGLALEAERAQAEVEREKASIEAAREREREQRRRELMELEEARIAAERARAKQEATHGAELAQMEQDAEIARDEVRATAGVRTAGLEAEAERVSGAARADVERMLRAAQDAISDERLRELLLTETLPRMADAFRDSFDQVTVTGGDMGFLGQGLSQVLATMRAHGVEPETLLGRQERTDET